MPHGFTWGLVLLKDLVNNKKGGWVNNIYNVVNNEITAINKFKE